MRGALGLCKKQGGSNERRGTEGSCGRGGGERKGQWGVEGATGTRE